MQGVNGLCPRGKKEWGKCKSQVRGEGLSEAQTNPMTKEKQEGGSCLHISATFRRYNPWKGHGWKYLGC